MTLEVNTFTVNFRFLSLEGLISSFGFLANGLIHAFNVFSGGVGRRVGA